MGDPVKHFKVDSHGLVVPGEANPSREWYDYGKDTGMRVRVKRVLTPEDEAAEALRLRNLPPDNFDRGEAHEVFTESEKAFRDGDDRAIGKIYEDLLDEVHSPNLGERTPEEKLNHAWSELEAALTAELREVSRAEGCGTWGFRLTESGLSVRRVEATKPTFEVRLDKKALKERLQHAAVDARGSAAEMVTRIRSALADARAATLVHGPHAVPFEREAS